jgi:hypothetical protein
MNYCITHETHNISVGVIFPISQRHDQGSVGLDQWILIKDVILGTHHVADPKVCWDGLRDYNEELSGC